MLPSRQTSSAPSPFPDQVNLRKSNDFTNTKSVVDGGEIKVKVFVCPLTETLLGLQLKWGVNADSSPVGDDCATEVCKDEGEGSVLVALVKSGYLGCDCFIRDLPMWLVR